MQLEQAIIKLLIHEAINGSLGSMATAYAMALGIVDTTDKDKWTEINKIMPPEKLERVKTKAWKKYNAMVAK